MSLYRTPKWVSKFNKTKKKVKKAIKSFSWPRQKSVLTGFYTPDKISNNKRYIHKASYFYKSDARKELLKRRASKQDVIMRKYKANGRTYYGIYQRSSL